MDHLWCEIDTDLSARNIERELLQLADVRTHYDDLIHPFLYLSVDDCDAEDRDLSEAGFGSGPTVEVWTHPRSPWKANGQIEALIVVWRALLALPIRGLAVMTDEGRLLSFQQGDLVLEDRGVFWSPRQVALLRGEQAL